MAEGSPNLGNFESARISCSNVVGAQRFGIIRLGAEQETCRAGDLQTSHTLSLMSVDTSLTGTWRGIGVALMYCLDIALMCTRRLSALLASCS